MSPICSKCNAEITEKIAKYSQGMWGKNFCYNCQKIIKEGEEKGD